MVWLAVLAELDDPLSTVVVTIEDVHWSDDGTLDVLRFLARRLESIRGVVVLTYRSDEIDEHHGLRGVLAALSGATTHRIHLQGLSRQALDTLTRDADISPDALLAVTGGNPFYVTEVLASDEAGVPPTVADAVIPSHVDAWLVDELIEHAPEVVVEAEVRGLLHVSVERVSGSTPNANVLVGWGESLGRRIIRAAASPSARARASEGRETGGGTRRALHAGRLHRQAR